MSKITPEAAHTLPEQLAAVREQLEHQDARAAAIIQKRREGGNDWSDVETAFAADATHAYKRGFE